MLQFLVSACLLPLVAAGDSPAASGALVAGTQLTYRGSVEAQAAEAAGGRKTFDLTLWITAKGETGAEICWLVEERGRGEFPWPERYGRLRVDAAWRAAAAGPALLFDRGDGRSAVPILLPFFASGTPLAAGASFREDKLEFQVDKATKAAERSAWQIGVRDPFGPKRMLVVDQQIPLVLALAERVIMGRGQEYQLKLEWIGSEQLDAERMAAVAKTFERLTALRGKLNLPAQTQEIEWKSEQLAVLGEQLPAIAALAAGTPLAKLVATAERDLQLQSGRTSAVADLATKFDGRQVEEFSVPGIAGESLGLADLRDRVTVLHFWDYRDEPLKEPYGQIGYLDFLYHRRKPSGVQVYGVAVDGRLSDEKTRPAAERGVRKLKQFMNLSYPVVLDSGSLIKQFGDPRLLGANLPLFVVIGPDQKILHYHVGHYSVHQDQGLKELDDVIAKALETKTIEKK